MMIKMSGWKTIWSLCESSFLETFKSLETHQSVKKCNKQCFGFIRGFDDEASGFNQVHTISTFAGVAEYSLSFVSETPFWLVNTVYFIASGTIVSFVLTCPTHLLWHFSSFLSKWKIIQSKFGEIEDNLQKRLAFTFGWSNFTVNFYI